jgi:hypothetical protein
MLYNDGIYNHGLFPKYRGKRLMLTKRGMMELLHLGLDLWDAADILNNGYDCSASRRKKNKIEKCHNIGRKVIRIVAVEDYFDADDISEEVFYIIHASEETADKTKTRKGGT